MANLFLCLVITSFLVCVHCSHHRHHHHYHDNVDSSEIRINEKSTSEKVWVFEQESREDDDQNRHYRKHKYKPKGRQLQSTSRPDTTIPASLQNSTCIVPQPKPTRRHRAFLMGLLTHGTYVTMADRASLDSIAMAIKKKKWEPDNVGSACIRVLWKEGDKRLFGFDQMQRPRCPEDTITDTNCFCTLDPTHKKFHRFTAIWTDGKHHALIAGCSAFGHGGWKVLSNTRNISAAAKKNVLAQLTKHNLSHEDVTVLANDLCPRYVNVTSFDGFCDPHIKGLHPKYKQKIWKILSKGVYTPMSNVLNIYGQSRFLRGQTLLKDEELEALCRKDVWKGNELTMRGFGNYTGVLHCDTKRIANINCFPVDAKSSNNRIFIYNTKMTMVWTDKKKHILVVSCLSNNVKTWALLSSTKTVDSKTEDLIAKKIRRYGFDPNKIYMNSYDKCEDL